MIIHLDEEQPMTEPNPEHARRTIVEHGEGDVDLAQRSPVDSRADE